MMKSKYSVCLLLLGIVTNTFAGYSSGYPMDEGYGSDHHPHHPHWKIWGGPNRNVNAPIEVEDESSIEDLSESQNRNPFQEMQLPPGLSLDNEPSSQLPNSDEDPDSNLESNENLEMEPETSVENRHSFGSAAWGILARHIKNKIIFYENVGNKDFGLIQVDVFFDGLCRKSRDFIVNHLFPAWKEFGDVFYINFVPFADKYRGFPYNKALNTQLAVIINYVPIVKKKMHLIRCLMDYSRKGRDQMQVLKYCSKICHFGQPLLNKLVDAINKPDASELLEHAKTLALARRVYNVDNIPTVFIDGVYTPKCLNHFKQTIIERAAEKGLDDLIQLTNMNQIIDSPLIDSVYVKPRPAAPRATLNIAEIVVRSPRFSTLLTAVKAAGLVDILSGEGPFTVFAPTNNAFAQIPPFALNELLANTEALKAVLLRHVVPAKIPSSGIPFGVTTVGTAGGEKITVRRDYRGIMITSSAGSAKVIITDICATNGVIHTIDYVL